MTAAASLAILPLGATEQHGPHLPNSTDCDILAAILDAAVALLPHPPTLYPMQRIGVSIEHSAFATTQTLSIEQALATWFALIEAAAHQGCDRILLLNGHGGQQALCELLAVKARVELGLRAVWCHVDALGLPPGLIPDAERRIGIHGGQVETALMLAIAPQSVNLLAAQDFPSTRESLTKSNQYLRAGGAARYAWMAQDLHPAGVVGNAAAATAEQGRAILTYRAKALAGLIKEVLALPSLPEN